MIGQCVTIKIAGILSISFWNDYFKIMQNCLIYDTVK